LQHYDGASNLVLLATGLAGLRL